MLISINDTRPLKAKLEDLTNYGLLDGMVNDLENFSRYTDPYKVMSKNWLWARWVRSN